jgi:hypothetical protein
MCVGDVLSGLGIRDSYRYSYCQRRVVLLDGGGTELVSHSGKGVIGKELGVEVESSLSWKG